MSSGEAPALRPLAMGEVLDVAVKVVARNFRDLAVIALLVLVPIGLLQIAVFASVADPDALTTTTPSQGTTIDGDELAGFLGAMTVAGIASALGAVIVTLASFRLVAGAYLGEVVGWRASLRYAARRLLSGLWLALLYGVVVTIALVLLILPGIWLGTALSLAFVALCVEDARGTKALRRSFRLVRGRWWATFAVLAVAVILMSLVSGVFAALGAAFGALAPEGSTILELLLQQVVSTIGSLLTYPFMAAVLVVAYLDLRVRKEAFDLRLLAERLEGSRETPEPAAQSAFGG